jgi:hypothetical protein
MNMFMNVPVSSWMPFKYNADGSRLYSPKPEALSGKWNPRPRKN